MVPAYLSMNMEVHPGTPRVRTGSCGTFIIIYSDFWLDHGLIYSLVKNPSVDLVRFVRHLPSVLYLLLLQYIRTVCILYTVVE